MTGGQRSRNHVDVTSGGGSGQHACSPTSSDGTGAVQAAYNPVSRTDVDGGSARESGDSPVACKTEVDGKTIGALPRVGDDVRVPGVGDVTRQLQDTSLDSYGEEDGVEGADSAFEEESSDNWLSPGLTRQNSCLESVPENGSLSRRSSLLDEDFKEALSRRASRESRGPLSRRGSTFDEMEPREPLGRRDSLLEAVLAAKKGGWRGLVRTDSVESGASMASVSSMGSEGSVCPCDDCLLGLTDLLLASRTEPTRPKKPSNWRKVRNIVQWTPFIQTYKKHKYPWVQLAGHQGNFRAGYKQGTILKKLCPAEEKALEAISADILRPYVARYTGVVEGADGEKYLQLEDLLSNFALPCVMDIKMGVRTYLEDELAKAREKPKLRKDMYEKMIQIDSKAPTEAEHKAKAVTKPRYMVWRETISSTATQGFRIEGVRRGDGTSSKDFKTTRTREQVQTALSSFLQGYPHAVSRYVQQLKSIKVTLETSPFFKTHELIGSSLLFVHNETSALVRMIDFAKTIPLPENVHITHRSPWSEGTHEDGYLLGLDNLIDLFLTLEKNITTNGEISKLVTSASSDQTNSSSSSITAISTSGNSHSALPVSAKPS